MISGLWIDNKPEVFSFVPHFEKRGFRFKTAEKGEIGLRYFKEERFQLVITDLHMEEKDRMDGDKILHAIRRIDKDIPVVACTGYADKPFYNSKLPLFSDIILKPMPMAPSHPFEKMVKELTNLASHYQRVQRERDFSISFNEFKNMSLDEALEMKRKIWEDHKDWILGELKERKAEWLMILGDKITSSPTFDNFPTDQELETKGGETNLTPFVYTRPPIIEESNWSCISIKDMDKKKGYYPTITFTINDTERIGDFDTGAEITVVSDKIIPFSIFKHQQHNVNHFSGTYDFSRNNVEIIIKPENKNEIKRVLPIASVLDWDKSGFVKINPAREALVGRDVLNEFPIRVELDSPERKTRIYSGKKLDAIVESMLDIIVSIENNDHHKKGHSSKVSKYAVEIAKVLNLPEEEIEIVKYASILHDIGMIFIRNEILIAPRELTLEERKEVDLHSSKGADMLAPYSLKKLVDYVKYHHKRRDGSGYPEGLKGDEIPLGAQIIAVADSFDAMISPRAYRPAKNEADAIKELGNEVLFDPLVVGAFKKVI